MQGLFDGKKLLVLGSNIGATDIVRYAKENGAMVMVADYYPPERSAAKRIADKTYLISTQELGKLKQLVEQEQIDGVLAGISEFNLKLAMELARQCKMPFYCTREQWDSVANKDMFRELCNKHGVPCPKTYYTGTKLSEVDWGEVLFPVVIKPVDAVSSIGVHICENEKDLLEHEKDTLSKSSAGRMIVEEFINGEEFTAHYVIANNKAALSCVDNRIPVSVHKGIVTTIPAARIYPSTFLDEYIRQVNPSMLELCESLGLSEGILFVQGLYQKENNHFYIFEAGLRCAGESPYRFIEKINGVNAMHLLVDHALGVKPVYDLSLENPGLKGKCCGIVSFVAKGGTVGKIEGLDEAIAATSSVIDFESRYPVGSQVQDTDTLRQLMIRFVMICDSREQMARDVRYLNDHITVLDTNGNDMVIKLQPERILNV